MQAKWFGQSSLVDFDSIQFNPISIISVQPFEFEVAMAILKQDHSDSH